MSLRILCAGASGLAILGAFVATSSSCAEEAAPSSSPSAAQASSVEEVVVTARRYEERQKDVPMSITAFNKQALRDQNIHTVYDLNSVVPGLTVTSVNALTNDPTYSIRGQGQVFGAASPSVVSYLADVPQFSNQIFDVQSVQVYKGPQGTLFGRNTNGGAIAFAPVKPTDQFNGFLDTRLGELGRHDIEWGVGGGYGDVIAARLSGQWLARDGYTKDVVDNSDINNENKLAIRGSVVVKPTHWLENYTIVQWEQTRENGLGLVFAGYNQNPQVVPFLAPILTPVFDQLYGPTLGPVYAQATASAVQSTLLSNYAAALAQQQALGLHKIAADPSYLDNGHHSIGVINTTTFKVTDTLQFKNIFSYSRLFEYSAEDFDMSSVNVFESKNPGQWTTQITEEAQVQGSWKIFKGTAGYYQEEQDSPSYTVYQAISCLAPLPCAPAAQSSFSQANSKAGYGEVTAQPMSWLALTAGARYTHDWRYGGTVASAPPPAQFPASSQAEESSSATTWSLAAVVSFNPDLNGYVTVRRGYKGGGINATSLDPATRAYAPEYVTDYEGGLKYNGLIGGWSFLANLDGFYDNYTNIQEVITQNFGGTLATAITNAAGAHIYGGEAELVVAPSRYVSVGLSYAYLHARYTSWMDPTYGDLADQRLPLSPENQLSIQPRYQLPLPDSVGKVTLTGNIYYESSEAFDQFNTPNGNVAHDSAVAGDIAPGYVRLDVRVDWAHVEQSRYGIAAYCKNLTDKDDIASISNLKYTQGVWAMGYAYGEPRECGAELRVEF